MENKNKKCSSKSHKEINATCYCFNCKIYMCNKCNKLHSELFDNHTSYNLDKEINEIFTGFCTEDTHSMKLKYYCKNHNKLCCAACIAKIQDKENGQHKNCDVCTIDVIYDEKKEKLEENIKYLENISNDLEQLINDIKLKYEKINVNKEDLKPHKKYFYVMQKYQDYAIITVDDDFIYANTMVSSLMKAYWKHPNCVIARRVHKKTKNNKGELRPYKEWVYECKSVKEPSYELFATGGAGALYPPNILNITNKDLPLIKETMNADDVLLNHIEMTKKIKILYVPDKKDTQIKDSVTQRNALYKTNCHGGNDKYIKNLQKKNAPVKKKTKPVVKKTSVNTKKDRPQSQAWNVFFGM